MNSNLLSRIKWSNSLFVEGSDDREVFIQLLNYHRITDRDKKERFIENDEFFEVKNCGGIYELLNIFRVALKGDAENKRYAVVVDAEPDINSNEPSITANWKKLLHVLNLAGYSNLPLTPTAEGVILQQDRLPRVGIWVMPNNKLSGAIEDFVSFLGPQDDELWPIAEKAVQQAVLVKRNFINGHFLKAHMHTWLAWQEEPGTPMGLAIKKKYVNADASHALQLIDWFCKVFELEHIKK